MEQKTIFVQKNDKILVYGTCLNGFGLETFRNVGNIYYDSRENDYVFSLRWFILSMGRKSMKEVYMKMEELVEAKNG